MSATHDFYYFPLREMERLTQRLWIFPYMPKQGIGAELGVFRGHFSEFICERLTPKKMYLVDPWTKLGTHFNWKSTEYTSDNKLTTAAAKCEAINRISRFNKTDCVVIEDFSQNFLTTLKSEIKAATASLLDFIYIDSSHDYTGTLEELQLADSVLAPQGIIAGDDWHPYVESRHHGVFRAVNEFIKKYDYQLIAAGPAKQFLLRRTPAY